MKFIFDGERPISWNKYYSGVSHWTRSKDAKYIHSLFAVDKINYRRDKRKMKPIVFPVKIIITAYMSGHLIDPDNLCSKLWIDGLKPWLLPDDTPEFVKEVATRIIKAEKDQERIEIEVI